MGKKERIDKRIKRKRRKIVFIILLLLFGIFLVVSFKTTFFNISNIEVIGNKKISNDKVIKASGNPMRENIFKVSSGEIEKNLKKHPYVKEAVVKRRLPNKLIIEIEERNEKFIISHGGSNVYLDVDGIVLKIDSEPNNKLTILKGANIDKPDVGYKITSENEEFVDNILGFIDISNKTNLLNEINTIDVSNGDNIIMELKDGVLVDFGPLNNVEYKLRYIKEILNDLNVKDIPCRYIYLNKGENPIVVTDNEREDSNEEQ